MSITAAVVNHITFTGDQESELIWGSGSLINSPAFSELVNLSVGNNTLVAPAIDGFVTHGVAIIPPNANVVEPFLKGVAGDTGVKLSASSASVIQLGADPSSIILGASAEVVGLRLVWF